MKPPTARSEEFLRLYRRYGSGLSLGQFCRRQGFSPESVEKWQASLDGFKEAFEAIRAEHSGSPTTSPAGLMKFGLTEDMANFLTHYRESKQKKYALDQVQWTPADLSNAEKNPVFAEEMTLIRQEIQLISEDMLMRKSMDGSLGHQRLHLESVDPEHYAKKINHKVSGSVGFTPKTMENRRSFWAQRLAGHLPAKNEEQDQDTVDAEYIEVGEPN